MSWVVKGCFATFEASPPRDGDIRHCNRGGGRVWHSSLAYTQAECDQLKKVQSDAAGREVDAKMKADA